MSVPRKETFLARYPRNLKLGAVGVIFIVLIAPWFFIGGGGQEQTAAVPAVEKKHTPKSSSAVQGLDSKAAIANASKQDSPQPSAVVDNGDLGVLNDQDDRTIKLVLAPDPKVTEDTAEGTLPRIGADGRKPWQVYARPFNTSDRRPRIAIVVTDLGLSRVSTDAAIARLPASVTLAFDAQSPTVGAWSARARQDGHETLLMVPMEPFDYPRSDPGPNTLLTSLPNTDNLERLLWSLRQGSGYVGITTLSGSRFTTTPDKVETVLEAMRKRGLMVFDARVAPHSAVADMAKERQVPVAVSTAQIDQNLTPEAIDATLNQLEQTARLTGRAVGVTGSYPVVLDRLQGWLKQLPQHGIALAPISAMVQ
ncbi:MAG: divergent polysaccharide deacetylase family protein [Alphaproteobacteria bacterium]|nr:divergent polysaccharide deacetylase family protein [Alphaproteobacteria bacterium]